ncbi:MAG: hypothetical protein HC904_02380 [Blastochloris sp.]|nr:hypothetical protein [Blastochloris sp.]
MSVWGMSFEPMFLKGRFLAAGLSLGLFLLGAGLLSGTTPPGSEIMFPADAGLVDITKPPYLAKGDGVTDDTAAIQKALDERRPLIFCPRARI